MELIITVNVSLTGYVKNHWWRATTTRTENRRFHRMFENIPYRVLPKVDEDINILVGTGNAEPRTARVLSINRLDWNSIDLVVLRSFHASIGDHPRNLPLLEEKYLAYIRLLEESGYTEILDVFA